MGGVVNDILNTVGDAIGGVVDTVDQLGKSIDTSVRDIIPGGWATVGAAALLAAGIYDPELLASAEEGTLTSEQLANAGIDANGASQIATNATTLSQAAQDAIVANPELAQAVQAGALPANVTVLADGTVLLDGASIGTAADYGATVEATTGGTMVTNGVTGQTLFSPSTELIRGANGLFVDPTSGSVISGNGQVLGSFGGYGEGGVVNVAGQLAGDVVTPYTGGAITSYTAPTLPADVQAFVNQNYGGGGRVFEYGGQTWVETANGNETLEYLQNQAAAASGTPTVSIPSTAVPTVDAAGNAGYYDTATGQTLNTSGQVVAQAPTVGAGTQTAGYTAEQTTQYDNLIKQGYTPAQATEMIGPVTDTGAINVNVSGTAGYAGNPTVVTGPLTEGTQLATQAEIDAGTAHFNAASNAWETATTPVAPVATAAPVSTLTPTQVAAGVGGTVLATAGGGAGTVVPVDATTTPAASTTTTTPAQVAPVEPAPVATTPVATAPVATTPVATAPVEPVPLTPVEKTVIPPNSSAVTPVQASTPPADITTAEGAAAAGYDAATIAKWVAAGLIASAVLAPPAVPATSTRVYNPAQPGEYIPLVKGGLNPGFISATPYYQTTSPVQAQYYWGAHNYSPAGVNLYNTPVAAAPVTPWGIQQGPSPLNIQQVINSQATNPINTTPAAPVAPVAP